MYITEMMRLPEHGHCENCGDPVPFGEYFCSDECSEEYHKDIKEAKWLDNRFYILMGVSIIGVAVITLLMRINFL